MRKFGKLYTPLLLVSFSLFAFGSPHGHGQLAFIQNKGQWHKNALYKADIKGGKVYLEKNRFTYVFYDQGDLERIHDLKHTRDYDPQNNKDKDFMIDCHAYHVEFLDAKEGALISGNGKRKEYHNYFLSNNQEMWAGHVPLYDQVVYQTVYPDIDMKVYSRGSQLKYDFIVNPGARTESIRLKYDGIEGVSLKEGNLIIRTSVGDIVESKPFAYQMVAGSKKEVACHYELDAQTVTFTLPKGYDESKILIIDPVLIASTYSGSTESSYGHCATYDNLGNIYTGAICFGTGYPVTTGAFQVAFGGSKDIAISKLNPDGSNLIYATYIGGSEDDYPHSLFLDNNDELHIYGSTSSANYPVSTNAYDQTFGGTSSWDYDIVVTKLNPSGSAIVGSTYIGGSGDDGNNNISVNYGDDYRGEIIADASGNSYVASCTSSSDFPATSGAFQTSPGGGQDGVVFKLNGDLSVLEWGTYLGGNADDVAYGLRFDSNGDIYVVGTAGGNTFPATTGTVNPAFLGNKDGFILRLQGNGSTLLAGTFWGTNAEDQIFFIDLDADDNVYVYGQTDGNLAVTPGVYSNPNTKQFISKLNFDLDSVIFSTVFGSGTSWGYDISPIAFMVDLCGYIYASGHGGIGGSGSGIPTTSNAFQTSGGFYLTVLEPDAAGLYFATYYGASSDHVDGGTSRFNNKGIVYQGVCTGSSSFPTTSNAWAPNVLNSGWDVAVFKIDFQTPRVITEALANDSSGCTIPFTVDFTNNSSAATTYIWDFGDGSPLDYSFEPSHVFVNPGSYEVMLIAVDSASCNVADTTYIDITVDNGISLQADFTTEVFSNCDSALVVEATDNSNGDNLSYEWDMGDGSNYTVQDVTHTYQDTGTYTVTLIISNQDCNLSDTLSQVVEVTYAANDVKVQFTAAQVAPCNLLVETNNNTVGNNLVFEWNINGDLYSDYNVSYDFPDTGTYGILLIASDTLCGGADTGFYDITLVMDMFVKLGPDEYICNEGGMVELNPEESYDAYLWSTGAIGSAIQVFSPGIYWLKVTDEGCSASDTVLISSAPPLPDLTYTVSICLGEEITLSPNYPNASSVIWKNSVESHSISVRKEDEYWFDITDEYGCTKKDTIFVIMNSEVSPDVWFPNTFTPNGDGINDVFSPVGFGIENYEMTIFNRWGDKVFYTDNPNNAWDGKVQGKKEILQDGTYIYKVTYKNECTSSAIISKIGHVSLVK